MEGKREVEAHAASKQILIQGETVRLNSLNETRVLVFNIKRCSFEDGPGIRTTVFLKGCPLRCIWCCNPEGQETHQELADRTSTREFFEQYMSVGEIIATIEKDLPFFQTSGGGVTIAGGEPTMHYPFVHKLLRECKARSIHTALDTCGYAIGKSASLLAEADLLLYDIKLIREDHHIRFTGVSNHVILENFKGLSRLGHPIIVRVPIIPGYTDSDSNIDGIGSLLSGLDAVQRVDLIAFHNFAVSKYAALNKSNILHTIPLPSELDIQRIKRRLERLGLKVQIGG